MAISDVEVHSLSLLCEHVRNDLGMCPMNMCGSDPAHTRLVEQKWYPASTLSRSARPMIRLLLRGVLRGGSPR